MTDILAAYLSETTAANALGRGPAGPPGLSGRGTVWEYTIGGCQVIKKWLSYREKELLGRGLTPDEVRYVTEMARRLAALVALQPALDDNYRRITADTHPWSRRDGK